MSAAHQHQNTQERHTNIAVVRFKKEGKKFEVAAYRNKVLSWRQGIETNIDEVLQVVTVFDNVSRGIHAKTADLLKVFGSSDMLECCKIILAKGEVQVGEKEREAEYSSKFRDIATLVASRCVNSQTGLPFTVATIETAMRDTIHFGVNPAKPTKQQANEVIERLKEHMPIARARIHVKLSGKQIDKDEALKVAGEGSELHNHTNVAEGVIEILANPSRFRDLEQYVKKCEGTIAVLQFSEISQSTDVELDDLMSLHVSEPVDRKKDMIDGAPAAPQAKESASSSAGPALRCTSCDISFDNDRTAQRAHYKTEFHTFNVKLKATGLPTVTALEFQNMSEQDKHSVLFDWKS